MWGEAGSDTRRELCWPLTYERVYQSQSGPPRRAQRAAVSSRAVMFKCHVPCQLSPPTLVPSTIRKAQHPVVPLFLLLLSREDFIWPSRLFFSDWISQRWMLTEIPSDTSNGYVQLRPLRNTMFEKKYPIVINSLLGGRQRKIFLYLQNTQQKILREISQRFCAHAMEFYIIQSSTFFKISSAKESMPT